jgi:hypothetical protein
LIFQQVIVKAYPVTLRLLVASGHSQRLFRHNLPSIEIFIQVTHTMSAYFSFLPLSLVATTFIGGGISAAVPETKNNAFFKGKDGITQESDLIGGYHVARLGDGAKGGLTGTNQAYCGTCTGECCCGSCTRSGSFGLCKNCCTRQIT